MTCCYLLLAASGTGAAFSPSLSVYMVFRFLSGWSISGIVLSTSILSEPQGEGAEEQELGDPGLKPRAWLSTGSLGPWSHQVLPFSGSQRSPLSITTTVINTEDPSPTPGLT